MKKFFSKVSKFFSRNKNLSPRKKKSPVKMRIPGSRRYK
jgi:hypothetical protein